MPINATLSLGSNIAKEQNLPRAIELLRQQVTVLAVSPIYETIPVGLLDQPNFWNCAVLIETDESAEQLKAGVITNIEQALHRQRWADKNAPRTIDIDLVLYGDQAFTYAGRPIPDPDILKFAHVAVPIADLLPTQIHPITGQPLHAIAQRLLTQANHGTRTIWQAPTQP